MKNRITLLRLMQTTVIVILVVIAKMLFIGDTSSMDIGTVMKNVTDILHALDQNSVEATVSPAPLTVFTTQPSTEPTATVVPSADPPMTKPPTTELPTTGEPQAVVAPVASESVIGASPTAEITAAETKELPSAVPAIEVSAAPTPQPENAESINTIGLSGIVVALLGYIILQYKKKGE